jgi:enterobactin synthetase component D
MSSTHTLNSQAQQVKPHPMAEAIGQLLPREVAVVASLLNSFEPEDSDTKRQLEFRAGRACAAAALARFGESATVEQAADRSPIWPSGYVGSISHDQTNVLAAVSTNWNYQSIGIDSENIVDQKTLATLREEIIDPVEWRILSELPLPEEARFSIAFSAKESFYKCWYPITKQFFGFKQATIQSVTSNSVRISMNEANPNYSQEPMHLDVKYLVGQDAVFTAIAMDLTNNQSL